MLIRWRRRQLILTPPTLTPSTLIERSFNWNSGKSDLLFTSTESALRFWFHQQDERYPVWLERQTKSLKTAIKRRLIQSAGVIKSKQQPTLDVSQSHPSQSIAYCNWGQPKVDLVFALAALAVSASRDGRDQFHMAPFGRWLVWKVSLTWGQLFLLKWIITWYWTKWKRSRLILHLRVCTCVRV